MCWHPDSFWIGVLHAEKKRKSKREKNGNMPMGTRSDNTSTHATPLDGPIPTFHRRNASVRQS
jgi:hypothetical protein